VINPLIAAALVTASIALLGVILREVSNRSLHRSQAAVNWEELAERASDRVEKMRELLDILREWQFIATPLLRQCAESQAHLQGPIRQLLGLNMRAQEKADQVLNKEVTQVISDIARAGNGENGQKKNGAE
jgi:hypothetical protein